MSKSHENIIDIKATPEEVCRAITDPEQIVKWFAPYARVDPRVGGEYDISWDPEMQGGGVISVWDPPKHFAQYSERSVAYNCEGKPVDTGATHKNRHRLLHRSDRRRNDAATSGPVRFRAGGGVG